MKVNFAFHDCLALGAFLRSLIQSDAKCPPTTAMHFYLLSLTHLLCLVLLVLVGKCYPTILRRGISWNLTKKEERKKTLFKCSGDTLKLLHGIIAYLGDLIVLYDNSNFYVLCSVGVFC